MEQQPRRGASTTRQPLLIKPVVDEPIRSAPRSPAHSNNKLCWCCCSAAASGRSLPEASYPPPADEAKIRITRVKHQVDLADAGRHSFGVVAWQDLRLSLQELAEATHGFSPDFIIGRGSSGFVYRVRAQGTDLAVKVLRETATVGSTLANKAVDDGELNGTQQFNEQIKTAYPTFDPHGADTAVEAERANTAESWGGSSRESLRELRTTVGLNQFDTEVKILMNYQHMHIVPLLGFVREADPKTGLEQRCLMYPLMSNGSLERRLARRGEGRSTGSGGSSISFFPRRFAPLTWKQRLDIAADTASGLEYLHVAADPPVIHRDVKPANILLDSHMRAKLADFGIVASGFKRTTRITGTPAYMPPESTRGIISPKLDAFSFGVVLLELLSGQRAFSRSLKDGDQKQKDPRKSPKSAGKAARTKAAKANGNGKMPATAGALAGLTNKAIKHVMGEGECMERLRAVSRARARRKRKAERDAKKGGQGDKDGEREREKERAEKEKAELKACAQLIEPWLDRSARWPVDRAVELGLVAARCLELELKHRCTVAEALPTLLHLAGRRSKGQPVYLADSKKGEYFDPDTGELVRDIDESSDVKRPPRSRARTRAKKSTRADGSGSGSGSGSGGASERGAQGVGASEDGQARVQGGKESEKEEEEEEEEEEEVVVVVVEEEEEVDDEDEDEGGEGEGEGDDGLSSTLSLSTELSMDSGSLSGSTWSETASGSLSPSSRQRKNQLVRSSLARIDAALLRRLFEAAKIGRDGKANTRQLMQALEGAPLVQVLGLPFPAERVGECRAVRRFFDKDDGKDKDRLGGGSRSGSSTSSKDRRHHQGYDKRISWVDLVKSVRRVHMEAHGELGFEQSQQQQQQQQQQQGRSQNQQRRRRSEEAAGAGERGNKGVKEVRGGGAAAFDERQLTFC